MRYLDRCKLEALRAEAPYWDLGSPEREKINREIKGLVKEE